MTVSPSRDGTAEQPVLRVASFNIRNGFAFDGMNSWPFRRRATARTIDGLAADIIGLQEVYRFQLRWLQRQLPRYTAVARVGRDGGRRGEMCPLLIRRGAATVNSVTTRWYGDSPDTPASRLPAASFPRIANLATLKLEPSGVEVQVINTHLDEASPGNRARSAEQLVGWLDEAKPHIVLGDLNAQLQDEALAPLLARLRPALHRHEGGTTHGFSGRLDGRRIDHVLVSSAWEVESALIAATDRRRRLPSDHWPIMAHLSLPWRSQPKLSHDG